MEAIKKELMPPQPAPIIKEYGFGSKATKNQGITKEIGAKYCLWVNEDGSHPSLVEKYIKTLP